MPKIKFEDDDLEAEVEQGASFRETAQSEGASIPFGCEQGICGTCLIDVTNGEENFSDVTDQEKETLTAMGAEEGQRLGCQCRIEGDVSVKSAH